FSNAMTARIDLSTTQHASDNLDPTFAVNVGADDVTVYPESPLTLSSAATGPSQGPKAFDIVIHLATPFTYNPANGNPLLDIRISDGPTSTPFDATAGSDTLDGMSRQVAFDLNSPTAGNFVDSIGLVTKFTFTPVPEPSTLALLTLGAFGLLARRRFARM